MTWISIVQTVAAVAATTGFLVFYFAQRRTDATLRRHESAIDEIAKGAPELGRDKVAREKSEHALIEIGEMKNRLGRRLAELRLEKETILRKRGPLSWFAREFGWHLRPDQYGALAMLLSAEQFDDLIGLFDAPSDPEFVARWDCLGGDSPGGVVSILRSVCDERQNTNVGRMLSLVERRRAAERLAVLQ